MKYVVSKGANVHGLQDDDLPVRNAARDGRLEIVKYLVSKGANIHAGDDEALRWAVEWGRLDVMEYLVSQGANIHAVNDYTQGHNGAPQHVVAYLRSSTH